MIGSDTPAVSVPLSTLALQPQGRLDQTTCAHFQESLQAALQQVTHTVIVDLLWVEAIAPEGLEVLKSSIQQALQMDKEIVFLSPNQELCAILTAEKMAQRAIALSDLVIQSRVDFSDFLKQPRRFNNFPRYNAADRPQIEKLYQKPRPLDDCDSMPSGSLYNDSAWHQHQQAG